MAAGAEMAIGIFTVARVHHKTHTQASHNHMHNAPPVTLFVVTQHTSSVSARVRPQRSPTAPPRKTPRAVVLQRWQRTGVSI